MGAPAEKTYTKEWAEKHNWWSKRATMVFFHFLSHYYGSVKTFLDVGCFDGVLPITASRLSIRSVGVDVIVDDYISEYLHLRNHNLSEPLELGSKFDMVVSWEVAEHLPPDRANVFADTVARHVGKMLFFSAAIPGQGGTGHVNTQPNEYWIEKLENRGLRFQSIETQMHREQIKSICGPAYWYARNMMCFQVV